MYHNISCSNFNGRCLNKYKDIVVISTYVNNQSNVSIIAEDQHKFSGLDLKYYIATVLDIKKVLLI